MTLVSRIYEVVPPKPKTWTRHQILQHKEKLADHLRRHPPKWERRVWKILKPLGFSHRGVLPIRFIAQFVNFKKSIVVEVNRETHDYREEGIQDRLETIRQSGYKLLLFRRNQNLERDIPAKLKETEK